MSVEDSFACVTLGDVSWNVRAVHRRFPNGGSWSFFICPQCGRRARVLRLRDERLSCWRCVGLLYRSQQGDKRGRIERLKAKLHGGPARLKPRPGRTLDRRWELEMSLRRALIAERRERLRGWKSDGPAT